MYHNGYVLDFIRSHCIILHFTYLNYHWVQYYSYTVMLSDLNRLVYKDTLHSQTLSGSGTRSCSTTAKPTKCTEHGKIQEGSKQCTVGAVTISCFFNVPEFITVFMINYRKTYSSNVVVIDGITCIITHLKSTLNPFPYCWRVKQVGQAVKQTIPRAFCFAWSQIQFLAVVRLALIRRNFKGQRKKDRMK